MSLKDLLQWSNPLVSSGQCARVGRIITDSVSIHGYHTPVKKKRKILVSIHRLSGLVSTDAKHKRLLSPVKGDNRYDVRASSLRSLRIARAKEVCITDGIKRARNNKVNFKNQKCDGSCPALLLDDIASRRDSKHKLAVCEKDSNATLKDFFLTATKKTQRLQIDNSSANDLGKNRRIKFNFSKLSQSQIFENDSLLFKERKERQEIEDLVEGKVHKKNLKKGFVANEGYQTPSLNKDMSIYALSPYIKIPASLFRFSELKRMTEQEYRHACIRKKIIKVACKIFALLRADFTKQEVHITNVDIQLSYNTPEII